MTNLITTEQALILRSEDKKVDYVADWLKFVADKTPSTVKTYNKAIKRWVKYLTENGISNPTRDTVVEYRNFLQGQVDVDKMSDNTARLYMTALKMFVRWLAFEGYTTNYADGVAGIKVDTSTHRKDALSLEEGKKVLASMKGAGEKSLRDKAIIALMMSCALRSIEVVRLNVGDIEKRQGRLFLAVHGKGRSGKGDFVMLPSQVYTLIKEYLKTRGDADKNSPLFVSTSRSCKGARLQTQTISRLAKKAMVNAGYDSPRLTAHSLRHTAVTLMFLAKDAGAKITESDIQQVARHKSISTTQIYRHDIDFFKNNATYYAAGSLFDDWHNR